MANYDFVNLLKVKASYGVLGNSRGIGFYPGYNRYSINNLNDNISLAFAFKGNPDLTWENSNQLNFGVEFELGNFVDGSFEYYKKNTTDMFFDRATGPSVGYSSIKVNDGEIQNAGFEFDLDFKIIQKEKLRLNFGTNGAVLSNEFKAFIRISCAFFSSINLFRT